MSRLASPEQQAIDARRGQLKGFGHLGLGKTNDIMKEEAGSLARCQPLQGSDERESDVLAPHYLVLGVCRWAGTGDGLDPLDFCVGSTGHLVGITRRSQGQGVNPAFPRAQGVKADIGGNAIQPSSEWAGGVIGLKSAPRPDERVLERVLGVGSRSQHPVTVAKEGSLMWSNSCSEGSFITLDRTSDGYVVLSSFVFHDSIVAGQQRALTLWGWRPRRPDRLGQPTGQTGPPAHRWGAARSSRHSPRPGSRQQRHWSHQRRR